ncbi:hypothetical protein [Aquisphaera insulae]|uniref:hypothetical protein n=1 Tax=Aquisphaera insulae TaxID=2712864 RepID=UPI0013ECB85F|nr:hypothetical protein [Aquisphaera insulae]
MASPELQERWRRTAELLRDARSHLSEAAEGIGADEIAEFEDHLGHNELELALDSLESAVFRSGLESSRILEFLISAAESMDLQRHVARYRSVIGSTRQDTGQGW